CLRCVTVFFGYICSFEERPLVATLETTIWIIIGPLAMPCQLIDAMFRLYLQFRRAPPGGYTRNYILDHHRPIGIHCCPSVHPSHREYIVGQWHTMYFNGLSGKISKSCIF